MNGSSIDGDGGKGGRPTERKAPGRISRASMIAFGLVVSLVGLSLVVSPAHAAPAKNASGDGTAQHQERGFADIFPCREDLGYFFFDATYNQQEHGAATRYTFTQVGSFTAYPIAVERDANGDPVYDQNGDIIPVVDDQGIPAQQPGETFSGHFQTSFGSRENANVSTESFTLNIHAIGSLGTATASHENGHVTTDGPGDPNDPATSVQVAFDHVECP